MSAIAPKTSANIAAMHEWNSWTDGYRKCDVVIFAASISDMIALYSKPEKPQVETYIVYDAQGEPEAWIVRSSGNEPFDFFVWKLMQVEGHLDCGGWTCQDNVLECACGESYELSEHL